MSKKTILISGGDGEFPREIYKIALKTDTLETIAFNIQKEEICA